MGGCPGKQGGPLLLETGGKEAGGRALADQRFWSWADESRSVCRADLEWYLALPPVGPRASYITPLASIPWYMRWGNASSPELFGPSAVTLRA